MSSIKRHSNYPPENIRHLFHFLGLSLVVLAGCNADPGARREIALLKANYVDLENQYFALKSRCEGSLEDNDGQIFCAECGQYHSSSSSTHYNPSTVAPETAVPQISEPNKQRVPDQEEIIVEPPSDQPKTDDQNPPLTDFNDRHRLQTAAKQASNQVRQNGISPIDVNELNFSATAIDNNGDNLDDGLSLEIPLVASRDLAEIQVSLLNPQLPNGKQRIGLWKYRGNQISRLIRNDGHHEAIEISESWQSQIPQHPSLLVFVRITNNQGETRDGSQPILARLDAQNDLFTDVMLENAVQQETDLKDRRSETNSAKNTRETDNWRPIR